MGLTKPLPLVTWEGMIAASQPMCASTMATNNLNGSKGAYLELASPMFGLGTSMQVATSPVDLKKGAASGVCERCPHMCQLHVLFTMLCYGVKVAIRGLGWLEV